MQSYLFPYMGYFDLIASVDKFVLMDDVQYINRGWVNRNNFPELFTFSLKKHHRDTKINECYFSDIKKDILDFKRKYPKLPHKYLKLLKQKDNLAVNIERTVRSICEDLWIETPIFRSSDFKHGKSVQGLIDITRALGGTTYVNAPGGRALYTQAMFGDIKLRFIDTVPGPSILCEL